MNYSHQTNSISGRHSPLSRKLVVLQIILATSLSLSAFAQAPLAPPKLPGKAMEEATECQIYMYCDDMGELYVNGTSILRSADWTTSHAVKHPLKKGDVITANVTDKQGGPGGRFAIVILKNEVPIVTAKNFRYATEGKGDWQTNPAIIGFKKPNLTPLTSMALPGGVKNVQSAWAEKKDGNIATIYFKCVVP